MRFWDGSRFTDNFIADPEPQNGAAAATNGAQAAAAPSGPAPAAPSPPAPDPSSAGSAAETSLIGRFVALLTPLLAIAAGWLAGVVGHAIPGVTLDQGQITAFMIAAATAVLGAAWKWLQGWQAHEQRVAVGQEQPVKPAAPASPQAHA